MKITRIDANGVFSDSGEALPDREQLVGRCKCCGQPICDTSNCPEAAATLNRILEDPPETPDWSEWDTERYKAKLASAEKKGRPLTPEEIKAIKESNGP